MKNSLSSNQIEKELDQLKIDPHWDDETIIDFYKKKTREICARLEAEEKIKKKELLLNNRKESAKFEVIKKVEEPESVLNMLFPYVNENDFRIEPFKSGTDIREEYLQKRQNSKVVKVNLERRIKSNFIRKYKKYDKDLDAYAKNPSIRCSSIYSTEEERRRQEFLKSKKLWVTTDDFRRYFSKNENEKVKEINKNEKYIPNKYVEPYLSNVFRIINKNKWISKKNFVV